MIRARHAVKALGLSALVLGLMAIGAGAAQAEVGSHWNVNGSAISATLLPTIGATLETDGTLLSKILSKKIEILCTTVGFEEAVLKTEGGSSGKIKFSGCTFKVEGVTQAACEPHTGAEKGVIRTKALKDLIVLGTAKEPLDRLEPAEGETFVTVETSEACSVGAKIPIIGKFIFKDCQNEGTIEKVTHLVEQGPGTELWVISKTAEHVSNIDGSANVALTGAHLGLKWSGTPA